MTLSEKCVNKYFILSAPSKFSILSVLFFFWDYYLADISLSADGRGLSIQGVDVKILRCPVTFGAYSVVKMKTK